jgi:hypothetical protein
MRARVVMCGLVTRELGDTTGDGVDRVHIHDGEPHCRDLIPDTEPIERPRDITNYDTGGPAQRAIQAVGLPLRAADELTDTSSARSPAW